MYTSSSRLNPNRPADLKEAYNRTKKHKQVWPREELPEFETVMDEFQSLCQVLAERVLTLMAIGLGRVSCVMYLMYVCYVCTIE